jgi:hypothetical protein
MPIRVLALVFDFFVLLSQPCDTNFPPTTEKTSTDRGLPSIYDVSLVCSNGANVLCFLSSSPQPPRRLGPIYNTVSLVRACPPIHMIGEVSWNPKIRRSWASLEFNPLWFALSDYGRLVLNVCPQIKCWQEGTYTHTEPAPSLIWSSGLLLLFFQAISPPPPHPLPP